MYFQPCAIQSIPALRPTLSSRWVDFSHKEKHLRREVSLPIGLGLRLFTERLGRSTSDRPQRRNSSHAQREAGGRGEFKTVLIRQKMVMETTICIKYEVGN
jgi:hypothetical protein